MLRVSRSTVGKKIIMAVTGLIGIGFVILHMAGNLQAFIGRDKLNAYSALLHGPAGELLWVVRAVLLIAVVLHVVMAVQLTRLARAVSAARIPRLWRPVCPSRRRADGVADVATGPATLLRTATTCPPLSVTVFLVSEVP